MFSLNVILQINKIYNLQKKYIINQNVRRKSLLKVDQFYLNLILQNLNLIKGY